MEEGKEEIPPVDEVDGDASTHKVAVERSNEKKAEGEGGDKSMTKAKKPTESAKKKETEPAQKKSEPVKRVLTDDEIGRMIDLGLGRGVNATYATPWLEKSSFQVMEVMPHNVLGTDEGGILQSFVDEVESVQDIQSEMSASIPASEQVSIGIDAELSRSYSTSRRSLGKKIITRSIAFMPDLEEVQPPDVMSVVPVTSKKAAVKDDKVKGKMPPFEQRLALWIIERLLDDGEKDLEEPKPGVNPIYLLANFIRKRQDNIGEVKDKIREKCKDFVSYFGITHYVSSIDLGASQYQVLSEDQFQKKIGVKNSLEILTVVSAVFSSKKTSRQRKKTSQGTEIGRIEGDRVLRGTTGEAVVGVQFRPISALVKFRILQSLLQSAIRNYIDDQEHSKAGPFIISCNNESIFLKVTSNYQVVATSKVEDSSDFYIHYNEDGRSAYEFSIVFLAPSLLEGRDIKPIPRYLYAPVSAWGQLQGPLRLTLNAHDVHSKLTLHSRREKNSKPVDTKDWLSSRDIFYISCKQRRVLKNSFIAVKRMPRNSTHLEEEYTTYCVPTVQSHDESRQRYMLFRLIRATKRHAPVAMKKKSEEETRVTIRRKYSSLTDNLHAAHRDSGSGIEMNVRSPGEIDISDIVDDTKV